MNTVTQNRTFKAILHVSQNHYLLTTKIQLHWTKFVAQRIEVVVERTLSTVRGAIEDDSESDNYFGPNSYGMEWLPDANQSIGGNTLEDRALAVVAKYESRHKGYVNLSHIIFIVFSTR